MDAGELRSAAELKARTSLRSGHPAVVRRARIAMLTGASLRLSRAAARPKLTQRAQSCMDCMEELVLGGGPG